MENPRGKSIFDLELEGVEITDLNKHEALQGKRYFYPKEPFRNEDWDIYHQRHLKVQREFHALSLKIEEEYKNFVSAYKRETL